MPIKKIDAKIRQKRLASRLIAVFKQGLESEDETTRALYGRILEDFLTALGGFVKIDPSGKWRFNGGVRELEDYAKEHPMKLSQDEQTLLTKTVDQALDSTKTVENSGVTNESQRQI
jgi:hypothetical protein